MIILVTGSSHTGKTLLAQKLLKKYYYPVLSLDLLKMGLIRSGQTDLTVFDDDKLTDYLWPIVREMIKTTIENKQNLIVEGGYIPFTWQQDLNADYLSEIKYICLIMSQNYILNHFADIKNYADVIEQRLDDSDFTQDKALKDNDYLLQQCQSYSLPYHLIDEEYNLDVISI
ncbi:MAG: adenylate kinase [Alphaproteobacteria bacterium]